MKILITSSDAMMYQFLLKHALNLSKKGVTVDVAVFSAEGYEGQHYPERIASALPQGSTFFKVDTVRSPLSPKNIGGYKQLKQIINNGGYDLVWTNEPVMGVLTRLAARKHRKRGMRVMYISHGFHFYKGAPLKNWLLFYPIEKLFAHFSDTIVTINRDDYALAKKHLACGDVHYIHGIGFDTERFAAAQTDASKKRAELGVPQNAFMLLAVGELNENKNHTVLIKALSQIENEDIYLVICGEGPLRSRLAEQIRTLGLSGRVILAGFREDIAEICHTADVFCLPSVREGLSISVLEAMSCGLPVVCSDIRGNRDLIENANGGFLCPAEDAFEFSQAIQALYSDSKRRAAFGERNTAFVKEYSSSAAKEAIEKLVVLED